MNNSTQQNLIIAPNKVINIAQAGYSILELVIGEDDLPHEVIRHPVIAWAINTEAYGDFLIPEAITLGGNVEAGDAHLQNAPVLCPDGRVRFGTDEFWASEGDYLQDRIERAKDTQRHRAIKLANVPA